MSSEAAAGPRFPAATSSERREAPVVERHRVGGMGCAWSCWTAGRTDGQTDAWQTPCYCYPAPSPLAAHRAFCLPQPMGRGLATKEQFGSGAPVFYE